MNIISIDFDIIMAPSIELYNSFEQRTAYENYYFNLFNADLTIYSKLTEWLLKWIPMINSSNIYFIESHEQIMNFIPQTKEEINLINIDHHHDLGYAPPEELDKQCLTCGNWGRHLLKNNLIKNYTWIKNGNSRKCFNKEYDFNSKNFYDFDFSYLKPDMIIICLSAPWVPEQYYPLYNLWISMASKLNHTQYFLIENT